MTIVEAVKALTEGKKIRRNDWEKGHYITLIDNKVVSQNGWSSGLCIEDFSEDCWEEYKEDILDEEGLAYLGKKNLAKYVKYCLSLALPKEFKSQIEVIAK